MAMGFANDRRIRAADNPYRKEFLREGSLRETKALGGRPRVFCFWRQWLVTVFMGTLTEGVIEAGDAFE
jgi:hypothetical protein